MTPLITRIEISEQTAASFESCRAVALRTARAQSPDVTIDRVKWSTSHDAMGWTMVVQWLPPEPERLWGLPGSETMFSDPIELYDAEVEPWLTDETDSGPWEVEEWSVRPTIDLLPHSAAILEWIADWVFDNGEVDEGFRDNYIAKTACDEVVAAAKALRQAIASKITYRMADEKVATWVLTRDPETDNPVVALKGNP